MRARPSTHRRRRWPKVLLGGFLALALLLVLGVPNLVLRKGWLAWRINETSPRFFVSWEEGWWLPFSGVHLRRFHLERRGVRELWTLDCDEVSAFVGMPALLKRRLDLTHVRIAG